jgi:hypothetical protein
LEERLVNRQKSSPAFQERAEAILKEFSSLEKASHGSLVESIQVMAETYQHSQIRCSKHKV